MHNKLENVKKKKTFTRVRVDSFNSIQSVQLFFKRIVMKKKKLSKPL